MGGCISYFLCQTQCSSINPTGRWRTWTGYTQSQTQTRPPPMSSTVTTTVFLMWNILRCALNIFLFNHLNVPRSILRLSPPNTLKSTGPWWTLFHWTKTLLPASRARRWPLSGMRLTKWSSPRASLTSPCQSRMHTTTTLRCPDAISSPAQAYLSGSLSEMRKVEGEEAVAAMDRGMNNHGAPAFFHTFRSAKSFYQTEWQE